jgi:hypothetical protein
MYRRPVTGGIYSLVLEKRRGREGRYPGLHSCASLAPECPLLPLVESAKRTEVEYCCAVLT